MNVRVPLDGLVDFLVDLAAGAWSGFGMRSGGEVAVSANYHCLTTHCQQIGLGGRTRKPSQLQTRAGIHW